MKRSESIASFLEGGIYMTDKADEQIRLKTGYGEYDEDTLERVHQENIRKARIAAERDAELIETSEEDTSKGYTWKGPPRKVGDHEISPYQGFGDAKQMQRAQSRKRRQVRRREASIWDSIAPKEVHGILNVMLFVIFALGLALVFILNGRL